MTKSSSLIFFGNERLSTGFLPNGAPTLQRLIDNGYNIAAVAANYEKGTSRKARKLEIAEVAKRHGIPVLLPEKPAEIYDQLRSYDAAAGILVAYGKIIPQSIIDIFPHGILNIHPSLLPEYRGSTPIEQAIIDGKATTGVTIMSLVKAMDAGPIYTQKEIKLNQKETKQELSEHLLNIGGELLLKVLPDILQNKATPTPQDETKASFTKQIKKQDGIVNWQEPAQLIERKIRAYAEWPKSRTNIFGHDITIVKARQAKNEFDGHLVMPCRQGFIEIQEVTAPSGRNMDSEAFLRGYKKDR
ncbi:MAG: methionyl-tRNA formyltransferase [Candidatus Woesebacteria bacterium]|jgi:methionyl-tRNA formyltransferase